MSSEIIIVSVKIQWLQPQRVFAQSFLSREIDENCRQTHVASHDATTNLELRILSEQLQENEQQINRPTQEEDTAPYTTLDHSKTQETHVYDVIHADAV